MSAEIRYATLLNDEEGKKAIQIEQTIRGQSTKAWIPRSLITYMRKLKPPAQGPIEVTLNIPEWLADKKNLHY